MNRTNSFRWIVLLVVALLASGCTGWAEGPDWGGGRGAISGRATVQIGGYTFPRTTDPHAADIFVSWVPEGWLGDHAGIAKHVAFYENGALKRVEIEIDVAWADFPGLWEHEFAHALGVDHVRDEASVMYPYLGYNQRKTLSAAEIAHVRLMYDIPSGQRLSGSGGYGALGMIVADVDGVVDDESNIDGPDEWFDGVDGQLSEDALVTGRREHVLYLDEALRR